MLKKYVDDLFLVVPANAVRDILRIFNALEPRIQFTHELESNQSIPFLDMTVSRCTETNGFTTNWYRKPIASGRVLNYHSLHPMNQKVGTTIGLMDRVLRLSDSKFFNDNRRLIMEMLRDNDYPNKLVNRLLQQYMERSNINHRPTELVDASNTSNEDRVVRRYCSLPYIPGVSERVSKTIKSTMENVEISMRSYKNIGKYFTKLKDHVPKSHNSNLVYSVPCIETTLARRHNI